MSGDAHRYAAFLRGMNLGGRRIKNEELRSRVEQLGFGGVATFRASGNVIFVARKAAGAQLAERTEAGLGEALGSEVPVFLRGAAELRPSASLDPFPPSPSDASEGQLQVALLA